MTVTPLSIDLVIKSFSRDYASLTYLLRSISSNLTGYRKLFLFLDDEEYTEAFCGSISSYVQPNWEIQRCVKYARPGYIEQQLYKLNVRNFTDADFILPLDSDMVVFRKADVNDWLIEGKAVIPYGSWTSPCSYPPVGLHSKMISEGLDVRHNIEQMIALIRQKHSALGCSNLLEHDNVLSFTYDGSRYSLSRANPHSAWLSSIRQLTDSPIDTMRAHYMFSKPGICHLNSRIFSMFGVPLDIAVDSSEIFPVFSEYQVYGNLIKESPDLLRHTMVGPDSYHSFTSRLPVIKCNSRQETATPVYDNILNGLYSNCPDRNHVLQLIRTSRQSINPLEDWC